MTTNTTPADETVVRTLIIKKRGRKYFDCRMSDHGAKLVINDVSTALDVERVVKVRCIDLSTRTKYGTELKFEPVEILDDRDAKALYAAAVARNEAEKWLRYAEADAAMGNDHSRAILTAMATSPEHTELARRVNALRERVNANKAANQAAQVEADKKRAAAHAAAQRSRAQRKLYPLSALPKLNIATRLGASVVVFESNGDYFRINEDHPSVHGHHLLGHEGALGCYVYYRDASSEEILALEQQESDAAAEKEAVQAAQAQLAEITADIISTGEKPDSEPVNVTGEILLDTRTAQGGGSWFVVQPDAIWHVRNNGMDGDNWAHNNVATGGAGGVGWRVPYCHDTAEALRQLDKKMKGRP